MAVYRSALPHSDFTVLRNCWMRDERISWKAKGLLGYLCSHAAGYKISQAQMVREGSDGREAVASGLRDLEAGGYLTRTAHRSAGRFAEDDYALADPFDAAGQLLPPAGNPHIRSVEHAGNPPTQETRISDAADMRETRQSGFTAAVKPQRETRHGEGGKPAGQPRVSGRREDEGEKTNNYNPLPLPLPGEEDEEGRGAAAAPSRARPAPAAAGFDEFWQAYPKKVGKDAARRAWARAVKRADPDKITAVALAYPWRDERQFVKDPARWLNEGCWEDDLDAVAAANTARSNGHRQQTGPYRDPPRDSYTAGPL